VPLGEMYRFGICPETWSPPYILQCDKCGAIFKLWLELENDKEVNKNE